MSFNYCPECAAPLTKESDTTYICSNGHPYWNNPKATVVIIFIRDGKLLFSKRGISPNEGKYDFPGGFIEYNEDVLDAAVREIKEETGVRIQKMDLHYLTTVTTEYIPNISVVDIVFTVRQWEGNFVPHDDCAGLEWKPLKFMEDELFVPHYGALQTKLRAIL